MLKDRGVIKWTSMMLPEHVEMLKEMWKETEKIPKPELDLQELERINEQIQRAYHKQLKIALTIYCQGTIYVWEGKIEEIHPNEQKIMFETVTNEQRIISFDQVIDAKNL